MGNGKANFVRETALHGPGVSASAIKMTLFEIIKGRSTRILLSVEWLKTEQMACIADKDSTIGTGNAGKNNFGDKNVGNNNSGEQDDRNGRTVMDSRC